MKVTISVLIALAVLDLQVQSGEAQGSLTPPGPPGAQNCDGYCSGNGTGIYTITAENCSGNSGGSGEGLYAEQIATGSYGYSYSGTGLSAFIASVCHGTSTTGTNFITTHNVNSF